MTKKSGRSLAIAAALAVTAATPAAAAAAPAAAAVTVPAPAAAAGTATGTPTVWVDARVSAVWHVPSAVAFLDRYTGTKLRLGKCHKGAECIVIREKWNMAPNVAGLTYVGGSPTTTIHLNGTKRGMGWGQRYNTMIQSAPRNLIAGRTHFTVREFFTVTEEEQAPVTVKF